MILCMNKLTYMFKGKIKTVTETEEISKRYILKKKIIPKERDQMQ